MEMQKTIDNKSMKAFVLAVTNHLIQQRAEKSKFNHSFRIRFVTNALKSIIVS